MGRRGHFIVGGVNVRTYIPQVFHANFSKHPAPQAIMVREKTEVINNANRAKMEPAKAKGVRVERRRKNVIIGEQLRPKQNERIGGIFITK